MYDALNFIDLLSIDKITDHILFLLLKCFKTPAAIGTAPAHSLAKVVGQDIAHRILVYKRGEKTKRKYDLFRKLNIKVISYNFPEYPTWLRNIVHFPPILFVRGMIKPEDEISVSVIGTRGATVYGKSVAEHFAEDLARAGVTVISGMARGIDTMAHKGALKQKGRTIAVLGCGVDICYPPENRKLMEEIVNNGAVISEFDIGTPPFAHNFPKRNRIVAGLSKAIIAIEAKEKSGVMNTVNWALDQNKDVFAVPGNIYSKASTGTNRLIRDGAIPITSIDEILQTLDIQFARQEKVDKKAMLTTTEIDIWNNLSLEPTYLDVLSETLEQPTSSILNTLLGLEIKGLVKQLPGMMFVKTLE